MNAFPVLVRFYFGSASVQGRYNPYRSRFRAASLTVTLFFSRGVSN